MGGGGGGEEWGALSFRICLIRSKILKMEKG